MNKWVIITGTSRGIGREMVNRILAEYPNYSIYAIQRNPTAEDLVLRDKFPNRIRFSYFDVKDFGKGKEFLSSLSSSKENPSILVNNAAIYTSGKFPIESSDEIFRVNYYAPKFLGEEFIRTTKDPIKIINISSGMGELRGFSKDSQLKLTNPDLKLHELDNQIELYLRNASIGWPPDPYSASKGALNTLTRIWTQILPERITCISVCPGWVRTDMGGSTAPRSVREGGDTPIWAVITDELRRGSFYRDRKIVPW